MPVAPEKVIEKPVDKEEAKKQKKRVKKDKDAPKKPMSPFFCYQNVRRPKLKAEQPSLENTELIKVRTVKNRSHGQSTQPTASSITGVFNFNVT